MKKQITEILKSSYFKAGIILIAVAVAYQPAMRAGFIWDDSSHLTKNILLRSWNGLWRIWFEPGAWAQYYPLLLTNFWLEYHLWGLAPFGYHFVNILLHGFNAILIWKLLDLFKLRAAFFAALIFALHPVQVESVAWISERKNTLSTFFYLLALYSYFKEYSPPHSRNTGKLRQLLPLLFYTFALFVKTVACSLPVAICLISWWQNKKFNWKIMRRLLPMFALGLVRACP